MGVSHISKPVHLQNIITQYNKSPAGAHPAQNIMPKIKKINNPDYKFAMEYECECGKKMTLLQEDKPERLQRCMECNVKPENFKL